jgi:serine/threonine-protein kinase
LREKDQLQQVILKYQQEAAAKDKELEELKAIVIHKDNEVQSLKLRGAPETVYNEPVQRGVSKTAFIALLLLTIGLAGFAAYTYFTTKTTQTDPLSNATSKRTDSSTSRDTSGFVVKKRPEKKAEQTTTKVPVQTNTNNTGANEIKDQAQAIDEQVNEAEKRNADNDDKKQDDEQNTEDQPEKKAISVGQYKVRGTAYFHNQPDGATRRKAHITHWNNAILNALNEQDGFIYVIFTNDEGQVSKGWLRKKDLIPVND